MENLLFDRRELSSEIKASFSERRRLVLLGRNGSGRYSAVLAALPECKVVEFNLRFVSRESDLMRIFTCQVQGKNQVFEPRNMLAYYDEMARTKPVALVIRNIDGCAGLDDESAIMGKLRSEMQDLHHVGIFYTAEDKEFIGRNLGHPLGAFFKQAVIFDVPELDDVSIDIWAEQVIHSFWSDGAKRAVLTLAGRRACDLSLLFDQIAILRGSRASKDGISRTEVEAAAAAIVSSRSPVYERDCQVILPINQRTVLLAIAHGMQASGDKAMVAATGIPPGTLSSVFRGLVLKNWLIRRNDRLEFADTFFRSYLAGQPSPMHPVVAG